MSGRGIAYAQRNGTRVAIVAEVDIDRATGKIWARKFTVAHDCGQIINPDGLVKCIEGNIVQGVSRTLWEEVIFDRKAVTSVDWMTYPILDITETPSVPLLTDDLQIGANLQSAPMRKIERIRISAADRERLERLVRDRNTPQKVVWRARIVLLASDGLTAEGIAAAVDESLLTVRRWRRRFVAKGMDELSKDAATRPSRVKPLAPEKIEPGGPHDAACEAAECDPLEPAQHGYGGRGVLQQCPADMACARA